MRSVISKLILAAFVLSLLPYFPQQVFACSCHLLSPVSAFSNANAVFSGKVVRIEDSSNGGFGSSVEKVYVAVDKVWKGSLLGEVVINTRDSSVSCGYPFKEDTKYLIYAYKYNENLTTSLCSRTQPLSDEADQFDKRFSGVQKDIEILGGIKNIPPFLLSMISTSESLIDNPSGIFILTIVTLGFLFSSVLIIGIYRKSAANSKK